MALTSKMGSTTLRATALRAWKVLRVNWHLGVTAFGGPPVHFKIFNEKFVQKTKWIDEQVFQELFSISQSLSGPASTKMLYCINLIQDGPISAVLSFLIWSLPGALGMYGLSIGVSNISDTLPLPVYALLSGLNAATVGVIALAAVELSHKAITDKMTRLIVFLSGAVGLLYNALWYFPVLMLASGLATLVFDYRWLHKPIGALVHAASAPSRRRQRRRAGRRASEEEAVVVATAVAAKTTGSDPAHELDTRTTATHATATHAPSSHSELPVTEPPAGSSTSSPSTAESEPRIVPRELQLNMSWKTGTAIIAGFFATFIAAMVVRSVIPETPLLYHLFANMYLAGTIIFGGGPVVVPLLREYVVAEGWVRPRDFLIGLALIQAFPGPNFNFAVFLGSLAAIDGGQSSVAGALVAWIAIFAPGLILVHGTMGIWTAARSRRWVKSVLRGINAGAVGLIYTAVYRIWNVGFLDEGSQFGRSLGDDPWWVAVTATSYVGGRWFGVNAPSAIVTGAVLGLVRYGVVSA